ncbi:hypothetical protein GEV33_005485 [Tenebrio molitor]|uniref:Out at first protein BRICHOS-like domain-containing protein n=1 Tax=Tenebrio molitor TaxID=7067 RepID=A0A8J6HLJ1_TENMO|nr:hypothetical protein GEV33_005485 [Tenebrio molitor]
MRISKFRSVFARRRCLEIYENISSGEAPSSCVHVVEIVEMVEESGMFLMMSWKSQKCREGGDVVQENIFANVTHDTVSLEFQRSDGTLITQVIDFRNVSTTTTVCVTRTLFYLPDYDTSPPRRNLRWGLLFLTAASARIALFIYSTRKFAAISRIKIVYGKRKSFRFGAASRRRRRELVDAVFNSHRGIANMEAVGVGVGKEIKSEALFSAAFDLGG